MNFQMILGVVVIIATVYFLAKRYESRLVLFAAGFVMSCIALNPMAAMDGFSKAMKNYKLIEPIVASMAFAYVMKLTKCDSHLVHFLSNKISRFGYFIIPGALLITAFINISITSSSGCSAAVGAIIIPLLMKMGVHPAIAGSTVLLGTYGSPMINPGYHQVVIAAEVAQKVPMDFVNFVFGPTFVNAIICAVVLTVTAVVLKEHKGYVPEGEIETPDMDFKVDHLKAVIPIVPVALLLLANGGYLPGMKKLAISHAMIFGSVLAFIVTHKEISPADITKQFFKGMGEAFGHVYGIITCSLIFVAGMNALGLIKALIAMMIANPGIAKIAGTAGPFVLAVICGSGDAAAVSFNTAVTVHAASFGLDPLHLGSATALAACLGRTMSPLAGSCLICAGYANVNPLEISKRNAIPTALCAAVFTIYSLYIL